MNEMSAIAANTPADATPERRAAAINARLVRASLEGADEIALLGLACDSVVAGGLPLTRVVTATDLLHPTFDGQGTRWRRGEKVSRSMFLRSEWATSNTRNDEIWRRSPFYRLISTGEARLRRRIVPEGPQEFPILDDLRTEGATDYLAFATHIGETATLGPVEGIVSSWVTDRPDGFTDDDIALITAIVPALALCLNAATVAATARTLLETYLGRDAAQRVLKGDIVRGRAETIHAVIWYSDLANFTRIADRLDRDRLLELLNAYAACLVDTVAGHGGEVLKFIGDGILAIFPVCDGDGAAACARALDAAERAVAAVAELNGKRAADGLATTEFYLALHVGELLYGNFGSEDRLDFTVLGPAVNEASRIEALCRALDWPIIVSSAFARAAGPRRDRLVSLGRYALRGVARPQELFTIDTGEPVDDPGI